MAAGPARIAQAIRAVALPDGHWQSLRSLPPRDPFARWHGPSLPHGMETHPSAWSVTGSIGRMRITGRPMALPMWRIQHRAGKRHHFFRRHARDHRSQHKPNR